MQYFSNFPKLIFQNQLMVDITRRAKVLEKLDGNPYLFLPYTIEDGDTIESIANYYYGDPQYSWLIIIANNIIDPYSDFFKSYKIFNDYIAQKYSKDAEKSEGRALTKDEIIAWTQNETITDNILWYQNQFVPEIQLSKETFMNDETKNFFANFSPKRIYDYETEENDKKRNIQLVSSRYVGQIVQEVRSILNG